MKNLLFILLALPMFAAAQAVQVPNSCFAGDAFTIRIPVRFPDSMTVKYMWYRNDTAVTAEATLLPNEKTIAYTVPANEAYGDNVAFHFKYHLDDGYDEWTASRKYVINFVGCTPPQVSIISGSTTVCAGVTISYTATNIEGVSYKWTYPSGWSRITGGIPAYVLVVTPTSSGTISVTPTITATGCVGETQMLAVTVNPLPTAPTTVDFSCSNYVTAMFTASGSTGGSGALSYLWSSNSTNPTSGTWTALTTPATISATSTNYYIVAQDANGCRSAVSAAVAASRPSVPTTVDYSCNSNSTATFTASGSTGGNGALSYRWSETTSPNPVSGTWNALTTTKTLTTTSTNYYMLAQDSKNCRSNPSSTAVAASLPAQPSVITGADLVCSGTTGNTYSVTNVANTTYTWTRPSGWTQTAGTTTNSITVTATTTSGNIGVTPATKGCVGAARSLAVSTVTCGTSTCSGLNTPGGFGVSACSGVTNAGTISVSQ